MSEAGEILGVSRMTMYRLVGRGDLPVVRIGDRPLVEPAAIRAFIEARRTPRRRGPAGEPGLVKTADPGGGDESG